jgi:hypothetical protein
MTENLKTVNGTFQWDWKTTKQEQAICLIFLNINTPLQFRKV